MYVEEFRNLPGLKSYSCKEKTLILKRMVGGRRNDVSLQLPESGRAGRPWGLKNNVNRESFRSRSEVTSLSLFKFTAIC